MYIGIVLLFSPVIALLKWIPLVGWLLAHLAMFVVWVFAFVVSVALSLTTIALAWLWYRPLFGLALLAVVGGLVALTFAK